MNRTKDHRLNAGASGGASVTTMTKGDVMNKTDAEVLIGKIRESQFELTKWEVDFISSIEEQLTVRDSISEKQSAIVEKLYRKSQGG